MAAEQTTAERLYALLPAVHRLRDAEQGYALRELLEVLAEQVDVLREDLDQLYDDQFIETASAWVAPYIGEVVGYRPLHGVVPTVASPRAEVANTIRYRRRKGTASMLEQLARDVTGWPARVVEYFERLVTTQYANHVRLHAAATPDLRDQLPLSWATRDAGAFDDLAHTADVRRIDAPAPATRGRHNLPTIGIFLFRTAAVEVVRTPVTPHPSADGRRFRFDPLGADQPLFGDPRVEDEISHLAEPFDVPMALGRRWLATHLGTYWGRGASLLLERDDGADPPEPVDADVVRVCDLSDVPGGGGAWAHEPPAGEVAVDPVLGRIHLGTPLDGDERLLATVHVGEAVPVGASGRTRGETAHTAGTLASASRGEPLQPLLTSVEAGGTLRVTDSDRYAGSVTVTTTAPGTTVAVRADDHCRPHLAATGPVRLAMAADTTVVLDGLLVSGGPVVLEEVGDRQPRRVVVRDCSLVPGQRRRGDGSPANPERASLIVLDPFAEVVVERSVVGPVVAVDGASVRVVDSVVDASSPSAVAVCGRAAPSGGGPRTVAGVADHAVGDGTVAGGALDVERSTLVGGVHVTTLDSSNALLLAELDVGDPRLAAVWAERRQLGCLRFSYVPEDARVGRRHRCAPDPDDPAGVRLATRPHLTSLRFGDPGYAQLRASTPDAIRRGADDESEMGVTHRLFTPQREANLRQRLDEYLRFGLEAGAVHAN